MSVIFRFWIYRLAKNKYEDYCHQCNMALLVTDRVPEIRLADTWNQLKNGFHGKLNKAFLHFLPNIWWFFKCLQCMLHFEKSSNMSKMWQKMKKCLNSILSWFQVPEIVSGTQNVTNVEAEKHGIKRSQSQRFGKKRKNCLTRKSYSKSTQTVFFDFEIQRLFRLFLSDTNQ